MARDPLIDDMADYGLFYSLAKGDPIVADMMMDKAKADEPVRRQRDVVANPVRSKAVPARSAQDVDALMSATFGEPEAKGPRLDTPLVDKAAADVADANSIRSVVNRQVAQRNRVSDGSISAPAAIDPGPTSLARGGVANVKQLGESLEQISTDALGDVINPAAQAMQRREMEQAQAETVAARPQFDSTLGEGLYGVGESIIQMLPGLAASVATGNPGPAVAWAGASSGTQAYGKYRARGATPGEAALGGIGEGSIEAATEMLPMGRFIDALGAKNAKGFIVDIGRSMGNDILGEQLATVTQDAIDTAIANPNKTWGQYFEERPNAALKTLITTIGQGAIMAGGGAGIRAATRTAPETTVDPGVIAEAFNPDQSGIRIGTRPTPPGEIAAASALAVGDITPEDEASPLPTEFIAQGKAVIGGAMASTKADDILATAGLPRTLTRVEIRDPDGNVLQGTIDDAFSGEAGSGVHITLDDGRKWSEHFDDITDAGVSITPVRQSAAEITASMAKEAEEVGLARDAALETMQMPAPLASGAQAEGSGSPVPAPLPSTPTVAGDAISGYMAKTRRVESGGSDSAKNPRSSATGRYQFTDGTWIATYRQEFGNTGETPQQILAKRGDGDMQDRLMKRLTENNAAALKRAGIEPTEGDLYLAHFAGEGGAVSIVKSDPNTPIEAVLGQRAVDANPFLRGKTAGEVRAWAAGKMGGNAPVTAPEAPQSAEAPDAYVDPWEKPMEDYQRWQEAQDAAQPAGMLEQVALPPREEPAEDLTAFTARVQAAEQLPDGEPPVSSSAASPAAISSPTAGIDAGTLQQQIGGVAADDVTGPFVEAELTPPLSSTPSITTDKLRVRVEGITPEQVTQINAALPEGTTLSVRSDGGYSAPKKYEAVVRQAVEQSAPASPVAAPAPTSANVATMPEGGGPLRAAVSETYDDWKAEGARLGEGASDPNAFAVGYASARTGGRNEYAGDFPTLNRAKNRTRNSYMDGYKAGRAGATSPPSAITEASDAIPQQATPEPQASAPVETPLRKLVNSKKSNPHVQQGQKVTFSERVGYLGGEGDTYTVRNAGRRDAYFVNDRTGGGSSLQNFDIKRALDRGVLQVQAPDAIIGSAASEKSTSPPSAVPYVRGAPAGGARTEATPTDILKFVARNGGLSFDGLNEQSRTDKLREGHDLRNSGSLKTFVPGAGPLLRKNGLSLDDMGERLWDAGYFGPPETTPRPTDNEIIQTLDTVIRRKEKRYSSFDQAPAAKISGPTAADADMVDTEAQGARTMAIRDAWDDAAAKLGLAPMFQSEIDQVRSAVGAGSETMPALDETDPDKIAAYIIETANRKLEDVRIAAWNEVEDELYAAAEEQFRRANAAEDQDRGTGERGSAPVARDEGERAGRGEDGPRRTGPDEGLDLGERVDPAIATRQRQETQLRAEAPLRKKADQDGTMGLGLFDTADQPQLGLDATRSAAQREPSAPDTVEPAQAAATGPEADTPPPASAPVAGSDPKQSRTEAASLDAVQSRIDQLNVSDKVKVALTDLIDGNPAIAGTVRGNIITLAMDSRQSPEMTINHEIVHAMKAMGLFRNAEWTALSKDAAKDAKLMASVARRYPDLADDARIEEAVADRFMAWTAGKPERGFIQRAFERAAEFIRAIGQVFRGQGFTTSEAVMRAMDAGKVGGREASATDGETRSSRAPETLSEIVADATKNGVRLDVTERSNGDLALNIIDTSEAGRGQGIGTRYMERLAAWADATNTRIVLTPDDSFGASSVARLTRFYKRFGFVENKGRAKDFSTTAAMIREPARYSITEPLNDAGHREFDKPGAAPAKTNAMVASLPNPKMDAIRDTIDDWRVVVQDKMLPVLRTQEKVAATLGRKIAETENAYLAEELMTGKVGARLEKLAEERIDPLFQAMHTEGVSVDELETFLYARHAKERNARIAKINPEFSPGEGSGMTDTQARAILARIDKAGKRPVMDALASYVDQMNAEALQTRVDAGLLSEDEAKAWRETYKHYVPLRGKAEVETDRSPERPRTQSGMSVKGKESRRAFGRRSEADNILAYAILQAEEAIIRAEKNHVAQSFLKMAQANPDPGFWEVNKIERRPVMDKTSGLVRYELQSRLSEEDAKVTVTAKVGGDEYRVTMNPENATAVKVATAMRNLDAPQFNRVMAAAATFNRYFSAINTRYNPSFVITNALRDLQTMAVVGQQFDVPAFTRKVIAGYFPAMTAKKLGSGEWSKWRREWELAGGKVYYNQAGDLEQIRKDITNRSKRLASPNMAAKVWNSTFDALEAMNESVERAIRLSVYKTARDAGKSKAEAASMSRNITVNFTRKGKIGPAMNAFYAFFNAAMQGNANLVFAAVRSKKVRAAMGGFIVAGFLSDMLNSMLSGDDEDGEAFWDKMPDHEKARNAVFMMPGGDNGQAIKIPLSYGLNALFGIGRNASAMMRGAMKPGEAIMGSAMEFADAFNPIGNGGSWLNIIAPTLLDPAIDITENKDFAGKPIQPEANPFSPPETPSNNFFPNVNPLAKRASSALNSATGGDEVLPGAASVSPEVMEYLTGFLTGGAGRFLMDTSKLALSPFDADAEVTPRDIPFVKSVVTQKGPWIDKAKFYDRIHEVRAAIDHAKEYRERGDEEGLSEFVANKAQIGRMEAATKEADRIMRKVRKARNETRFQHELGRMDDETYRERMDAVTETEERVIAAYNKRWNDVVEAEDESE